MRAHRLSPDALVFVVVFLTLAICVAAPGNGLASGRHVLAMFRPGALVLPGGSNRAPTAQVAITSSGIDSAFAEFEVDSVAKAFPNFQLADTLGTARTGEIVRLVDRSRIYTLVLQEGGDPEGLCQALAAEPEVVYAEPDGSIDFCTAPNDPYYQNGDQWNLNNLGQNGGLADADIDAPEAWEITTGSNQTTIAILDSGVQPTHEEFAGKVFGDTDFSGDHGTHVAGVAAANTNTATPAGIAGVDWNARINAQNISSLSQLPEDVDPIVVDGVKAALSADAQILNNSWILIKAGGPGLIARYSPTVEGAFSDAYKLNRVAVAAMGNANVDTTYYPAGFGQGVIAVGGTNRLDQRSSQSSSGPHIDVCAPGQSITSAVPDNSYGVKTGTSQAAPHVSGVSSLMLAVNPNLYNDDIEQILRLTADDLGTPGWDKIFGTGRINARRALERLVSPYGLFASTETSGARYDSSAYYALTFVGVSGLAEGEYVVRRYDVRRPVTFAIPPLTVPDVWGRGVGTRGFSDEGRPGGTTDFGINFGRGWCEPIAGTVTQSGCVLRTYVYKVDDGQTVRWFPCAPEDVIYHYAVLEVPAPAAAAQSLT